MKTQRQNIFMRILFIALLPLAIFACGDEADYMLEAGVSGEVEEELLNISSTFMGAVQSSVNNDALRCGRSKASCSECCKKSAWGTNAEQKDGEWITACINDCEVFKQSECLMDCADDNFIQPIEACCPVYCRPAEVAACIGAAANF